MLDLGDLESPAVSLVATRIDGGLGAPLVVVPGAVLTPDQAFTFAKAVFSAGATACTQSREDVAGHA